MRGEKRRKKREEDGDKVACSENRINKMFFSQYYGDKVICTENRMNKLSSSQYYGDKVACTENRMNQLFFSQSVFTCLYYAS